MTWLVPGRKMPRRSPPHIRERAEKNNELRAELKSRLRRHKDRLGWPASRIAEDAGLTGLGEPVKVVTAVSTGIANPDVRARLMAWCDKQEADQ